jgi:hypothetical protein
VTRCETGLIEHEHEISDDTCPHPDPLPRGEGEHHHDAVNFLIFIAVTDSVSFTNQTHDNPAYHTTQNAANNSPSPGGEGRGEGERESNSAENVKEPQNAENNLLPFHGGVNV